MAGVLAATLVACSDALEKTTPVGQEIVVLDGRAASLTLVNAGDFTATSLSLPFVPVNATVIAGRGPTVLIPVDSAGAVQILGLDGSRNVAAVPFAVGVAFQDDSTAWVTLNGAIGQLSLRTGTLLQNLVAGARPVAVAVVDSQVFAVNAGAPSSLGSLSAYPLTGAAVPDTIALSGVDAHYAIVGDDSLLYVIERGDSGKADGRLSVVDPVSRQEIVVINGLGERPGPGVFHPTGRILIASPTDGILEVDANRRALVRGPGAGIKPEGQGVLALSLDNRGRVYAVLDTGCGASPGALVVLSPPPDYRMITTVPLGLCPVASTVAEMPTQ